MSRRNKKPKIRISLTEKEDKVFLRIEYQDYSPIAQALELRGLEKYYTTRLFGEGEGYVYRYVTADTIVPESRYEIKVADTFAIYIRVIDDINEPVFSFDTESYDVIVNMAVFRVIPRREGDVYVTEAPIRALYVPRIRKFFQEIVKLYKIYLTNFISIKRVKLNVEFW